ncbi:PRC-barrel domain protein [Methylocella silvestris BL2]|uniref:PRC-barrel domain protein n=1 Tax=Methylocella silvestris (strain DSM 15510 / CIP 108128 / LMG 27833 / NCIMB 13906 / BL2) TaxID=395965 RepID=B8ER82_METSB|nr:PRC-barrel domain protein [Methylocella silvestris BL2]
MTGSGHHRGTPKSWKTTTFVGAATECCNSECDRGSFDDAFGVALTKVDPHTVATGQRASKIVGASVVNDADETVGKVDDLLITPTERAPYAILSVGGILGLGSKYVVIPFSSLQMQDKRIMLPCATKDQIKAASKALPDLDCQRLTAEYADNGQGPKLLAVAE